MRYRGRTWRQTSCAATGAWTSSSAPSWRASGGATGMNATSFQKGQKPCKRFHSLEAGLQTRCRGPGCRWLPKSQELPYGAKACAPAKPQ